MGRIRTRLINGTTDTYSYLGSSESVVRIATGGTNTDSLSDGAGTRLGVKVGSTVNWFLPDLHGNIASSLDVTGATVTNAVRYDAYGMTLASGGSGSVGAANWLYQGRLDVSPAGLGTPLYEAGARMYSAGLGTFTGFDSVRGSAQDPVSLNRYLYAAANPATLIDPTGHSVYCGPDGTFCGKDEMGYNTGPGTPTNPVGPVGSGIGGGAVPPSSQPGASTPGTKRTPPGLAAETGETSLRIVLASASAPVACGVRLLDCSFEDFRAMSASGRLVWLQSFQQLYDTGGWFNAIEGVLSTADSDNIFANSEWSSTVDAHILQAIQDGRRIVANQAPTDKANPGSVAWARFFDRYYATDTNSDDLKVYWGTAEQTTTDFGVDDAENGRHLVANYGDRILLGVTQFWRAGVRAGPDLNTKAGLPGEFLAAYEFDPRVRANPAWQAHYLYQAAPLIVGAGDVANAAVAAATEVNKAWDHVLSCIAVWNGGC